MMVAHLQEFMVDNTSNVDPHADVHIPVTFDIFSDTLEREFNHVEEQDIEYRVGDSDSDCERSYPAQLRLDSHHYANIYADCFDYSAASEHASKEYISSLNHILKDALGFDPTLKYTGCGTNQNNYTLYINATIPLSVIRELILASLGHDQHQTFKRAILDDNPSYSSRDYAQELFQIPVGDWEPHDISTLLMSCAELLNDDSMTAQDISNSAVAHMCEHDDFYNAWHAGLDFDKVKRLIDARRVELRDEWLTSERERDPLLAKQLLEDYPELVSPTFFPHVHQYVFSFYKLTSDELGINT